MLSFTFTCHSFLCRQKSLSPFNATSLNNIYSCARLHYASKTFKLNYFKMLIFQKLKYFLEMIWFQLIGFHFIFK